MSWKQEIFRTLLLALGTFEILTNMAYLIKKDGISLSRKQHQELPSGLSDKKMKLKVQLVLFFGALFFSVSLFSYVSRTFNNLSFLIALILFAVYGIVEALSYRYWKTIGFAFVTLILLSAYLFF